MLSFPSSVQVITIIQKSPIKNQTTTACSVFLGIFNPSSSPFSSSGYDFGAREGLARSLSPELARSRPFFSSFFFFFFPPPPPLTRHQLSSFSRAAALSDSKTPKNSPRLSLSRGRGRREPPSVFIGRQRDGRRLLAPHPRVFFFFYFEAKKLDFFYSSSFPGPRCFFALLARLPLRKFSSLS